MNHSDTLHNPVIGVHVEVITSTIESSGQLLHIRSTMRAKQMDPVAYHFHKGFSEEFTVVSGRLDLIFGRDKQLPSEGRMMKHVRKEYSRALKNGDDPMRVQTLEYLDRLAGILGIRPRLYRHPHLFMKLAAGPLVPARYRLDGMGSRSGVARKILNSF